MFSIIASSTQEYIQDKITSVAVHNGNAEAHDLAHGKGKTRNLELRLFAQITHTPRIPAHDAIMYWASFP